MKKLLIVVAVLLVGLALSKVGFSEVSERDRWIEEEKRKDLEKTEERVLRGERKFYVDTGGWLSGSLVFNSNNDNRQADADIPYRTQEVDLRSWVRATLLDIVEGRPENDFYFYLRCKSRWLSKDPADADIGIYDSDFDGLRLDMGYVNLDFRPLFKLRAGRQFMRLGRGIVYNNVHEGIELSNSYSKFEGKVFFSATPQHEDNIDYSVPGYDNGSDRNFMGVEATLLTIPGHRPYAYVLVESDHSEEEPNDPNYEYDYDGNYFGLGSKGELVKDLRYWLEAIRESGHSYRYDDTTSRSKINAWALDMGLSYYWDVNTHPSFSMEYAYGSGDSDRQNVTNTVNGNKFDDDNNFMYFGYYAGGFALAPRLSNLRVFALGASFKPLELSKDLEEETKGNFQIGTKCHVYRKVKAKGGISDLDCKEDNRGVGYEIDVYSNWRILSDLVWSLQYGHFHPGKAYGVGYNDNENYWYTNLVLSF